MNKETVKTDEFLEYANKNSNRVWIFLDTETLGLNPEKHQLLEVAAKAVSFRDMKYEHIDSFNKKVKLLPFTKKRLLTPYEGPGLSYRDIFSMTNYGQKFQRGIFFDEGDVIKDLIDFIDRFEDPLLVAHNSNFDMNYLTKRYFVYENRNAFEDYEVLDSLQVMKKYFSPMVITRSKALRHKSLSEEEKTHINMMRDMYKKLKDKDKKYMSLKLGRIAQCFDLNMDKWHTATHDVETLVSVMQSTLHLFEKNKGKELYTEKYFQQGTNKNVKRTGNTNRDTDKRE